MENCKDDKIKFSIVLPTYNEGKNLIKLVDEIVKIYPCCQIIIVDDNSPDGTGFIADGLAKKYKCISVIHRPKRLGLSSAVYSGFLECKNDIIGVMDADFSHPSYMIGKLVKKIELGHDIAIASRYIKNGRVERWSIDRMFISAIATIMGRFLVDIKDPMSGFFFMKKNIIEHFKIKSKGYKILLEILVKSNTKSTVEIGYIFRTRKIGKSKLNTKEYIRYLDDWLRLVSYKLKKI